MGLSGVPSKAKVGGTKVPVAAGNTISPVTQSDTEVAPMEVPNETTKEAAFLVIYRFITPVPWRTSLGG